MIVAGVALIATMIAAKKAKKDQKIVESGGGSPTQTGKGYNAKGEVMIPAGGTANRPTRNKNPMNIRNSQDIFKGEIGTDQQPGGFKVFDTEQNGVRAAFKIMMTYNNKYGLKTLREKMRRWAPASENRPTYPDEVANMAGMDPDVVVGVGPSDLNLWLKIVPQWAKLEGYERNLSQDLIKNAYIDAIGKV